LIAEGAGAAMRKMIAERATWVHPLVSPTSGRARATRKKRAFLKKGIKASFDPDNFLAKVGDGKTVSIYQNGQIVFSQGDVADAIFYIQKGNIKITVVSERGKEAVVGLLGPHHFFGEGSLNGQPQRATTATAFDECLITRLPTATLIAVVHDEPKFAELFIADLLSRNSRIEEDLIDQLLNSSEKRLARMLLVLANFGKQSKPEPIIPKISQETLAEMIGTTRSRVSFFMNKFRKLGFIAYNGGIKGGIEVHSSLLNVVLTDRPRDSGIHYETALKADSFLPMRSAPRWKWCALKPSLVRPMISIGASKSI
jgi:CRP-like cAMP-binding protein